MLCNAVYNGNVYKRISPRREGGGPGKAPSVGSRFFRKNPGDKAVVNMALGKWRLDSAENASGTPFDAHLNTAENTAVINIPAASSLAKIKVNFLQTPASE